MSGALLYSLILPLLVAVIAGAVAGGLAARWFLSRSSEGSQGPAEPEPSGDDTDPFVDAAIDIAAVRWQEVNRQPREAAGLMAARLKTLNKIGKGKGWF